MARLKATVTYAKFGYIGQIVDGKGNIYYAVYSHKVSQFKVIDDFKSKKTRKQFVRQ